MYCWCLDFNRCDWFCVIWLGLTALFDLIVLFDLCVIDFGDLFDLVGWIVVSLDFGFVRVCCLRVCLLLGLAVWWFLCFI